MQLNKNQTVEVNIKDLIFHLLYRWRSILIAALIGAVVLCGYQYLTVKTTHDAGKQTKEERQYQLKLQNYHDNLENSENTVRVNTKLLQGLNTYRKESMYYQLDSQAVWTASNKYLIRVDQSVLDKLPQGSSIDPADSILAAYSSPLSEATDEEMMEAFGTERPEYIGELVTTEILPDENTVKVIVKAATKEEALAGMKLLHQKMQTQMMEKAQEIEKHTLSLVSEQVVLAADELLTTKQETLARTVKDYQEALQEARETLDDLQASGEPKAPGTHLVKMAVLGFVLGAFILLVLYAALYIFRGRINNAGEMTERYGLPLFGEIQRPSDLHGQRTLDKLFARWELGKEAPGADLAYDSISALIAKKENIRSILLVSSLAEKDLFPVREALAARLPEITIECAGDMLRNSKAVEDSTGADGVILVEKRHLSRVKDTDRMVESLMISGANVVGSIML